MDMGASSFLDTRPELRGIIAQYGKYTIPEYVAAMYTQVSKLDLSYFDTRFLEFCDVYRNTLQPLFDTVTIDHSIETLNRNRLISTADHHGVIAHPFSISSAYARTRYAQHAHEQSVITFPCASISLSNSSFPRGLMVHDSAGVEKKFYFKTLMEKLQPVYTVEKVDKETVQKMYDSLALVSLDTSTRKKLLQIFKAIFFSDSFLQLATFDEQCTYASCKLWKYVADFQNIDLIYLSQEKIVTALLLQKHIGNDTVINSLLFDPTYHQLFVKYFDGITGAFDTGKNTGTHLFWGIRDGKRVSLFLRNGSLIDSAGNTFVILHADTVRQALQEKKIMPSMPLVFIVLSFYYGLVCGGGFSQVDYLGAMKFAWMQILKSAGEDADVDHVQHIPTNIYLGDFAFLKQNDRLMSSLDLVISEVPTGDTQITLFTAYTNLLAHFLKIHF